MTVASALARLLAESGASRVTLRRDVPGDRYFRDRRGGGARRPFATTGMAVREDGRQEPMDLALSTQRELLELIDHLEATRGLSWEAAYVLASVAVDLRLSEVVDVPNPVVSALLPLDVFDGA